MTSGRIQVYTGNGKGKTTAALGLALRAAGAGKRTFIGQFVKGMVYSEDIALKVHEDLIIIEKFGLDCFIYGKPSQKDIDLAKAGLEKIKQVLISDEYDIVIFDEANIALYYNLFSLKELIDIIELRNHRTEIIITGRYAPQGLIELADLVTEMVEVKHYFNQGVEARTGIEN